MAWTGRAAEDPPVSPVTSDEPEQTVTLVPFGAQTLRVTAFPCLGKPATPAVTYQCDFADVDAPGWVAYGGGWYVRDGALHPATNEGHGFGSDGMSSIATATDFADLDYAADVTPGSTGDAGLVFRASHPALGANAFDGYYAGVSQAQGRVVLGRCRAADNAWTELASAKMGAPLAGPIRLKLVAVGSDIRLYVGDSDKPTLTATDGMYAHGAIGVRRFATAPSTTVPAFANIFVRPPVAR